MKIMTYNTFMRPQGWLERIVRFDDAQIARARAMVKNLTQRSGIDVLMLQEVFHSHATQLIRAGLAEAGWKYQTEKLSAPFTPITSGVVICSKTPFVKENSIVFQHSCGWDDSFVAKGVLHIETVIEKKHIHIFNLHLQSSPGTVEAKIETRVREAQIEELNHFIEQQHIPVDHYVFVAGDFNTRYQTPEYSQMIRALHMYPVHLNTRKYSYSKDNQLSGFSVEQCRSCSEKYKRTHQCDCCIDQQLDYIFSLKPYKKPRKMILDVWQEQMKPVEPVCSNKLGHKLDKLSTDRCPAPEVEIRDLSDHYPVVARIKF